MSRLELRPISLKDAKAFIIQNHAHHVPPQGWKFGTSVWSDGVIVGVVTVGRPVARALDDGMTAEVTRCCTDRTKHVASMLYGAARNASKALGYRRVITYTLVDEPGTSLKAAGWKPLYIVKGRSWSCPSRPRTDKHPTIDKRLWEATL